ncbi:MAG: glycerophosphodiester phosphodiesterase family protein [Actinomycetota bacterium]
MRRVLIALGLLTIVLPPAPAAAAPGTLVIAHRGGAGLWPENTLEAFRRSVRLRVDVLEMDVKITADGVPVVIHDAELDRTTNCTGLVADRTFAQLQACDAGYRFSRDGGKTFVYRGRGLTVPSLELVMRFARSKGIRMNPEIKNLPTDADFSVDPAAFTMPIAAAVRASGAQSLVTFASFWPPNLDSIESKLPGIRTALLTQGLTVPPEAGPVFPCLANVAFATVRGYEVSQPEWTSVDLEVCVDVASALGRPVEVWTADDPADMAALVGAGVAGIITNRPDLLLEVLGRR